MLFLIQKKQQSEYASYHNTMSRRSLFGGAYPCTKYKYSYPSDVSLQSTYGYTSASAWGLWRDTGNLSPSVYSKKRINIRSFSILIMSAAFIVLLAVLSVAAFAFYFSTFKSDASECKFNWQMAQRNVYNKYFCSHSLILFFSPRDESLKI